MGGNNALLNLLFVGVDIPNLFGSLLQQLRRHAHVFHFFGVRGHSLQDAQAIGLVGDRYIGNFIEEAVTGGVEHVDPFFRQRLAADLRWVMGFSLLAGYFDTKSFWTAPPPAKGYQSMQAFE
jgi:hypothetical protein